MRHGLAKRAAPDGNGFAVEQAIDNAYRIALARDPDSDELAEGLAFIKQQMVSYGSKPDARLLAITDFCQTLMCLNEFVYVE